MRGLLLRLSGLDADAESAVRVIGFFDRLITERAGLDALVRSTSELAGCPVGLSAPGQGLALRADTGGAVTAGPVPARAAVRALEGGVRVWVAREGTPAPLDDMLLERFAIAAAVLLEHSSVPLPELGDPALIELVLSESVGTAERSRALHLLGIAATAPLRVLAATGEVPGRSVLLGTVRAVLSTEVPDVEGRLGIGPLLPAIEAARSWHAARTALRYTSDSEPVVWWERLGGLALLAEQLDSADIAALPDVRALDRLAAEPGMITMLDALSATGSVRKAAAVLHRHHSTMTARLVRAESVLGFGLDEASGRFRLHLALMLRRLRDNA
ncbi:PucR C-terminal helix-turn-helix domain-containing protein [Lentzea waywayandensis]|uniref:PucR C-terminal helix-turn-helix domain-containing protein n=1 Tax=Lentzea waywayandensis TaxID=84724 RepID=A0A1I6DIW7_9PSEU|nr:helix-turn-helix domain-containing protein [Lentzea waywayandensis]SFR05376.1 PucR C-terminal helix-turn-helix domain-containing protein [Lentzea waywayandensis]